MMILLIGPFPDPINGCSVANKVLLKNLRNCGRKVNIINTSVSKISNNQGSGFFKFSKIFPLLRAYLLTYKILNANVIYTTPGQTFFGILKYAPFYIICIFLRIPYVIHLHGNYLGDEYDNLLGFKKKIFFYFISNASAGIVLSESLKSNFSKLLPENKIFVIENFVEDHFFKQPFVEKNDFTMKIIFLSNLMEEKGIFILLDVLENLSKINIQYEAIIAGGFESETKNRVQIKINKLFPKVKYVGIVNGEEKFNILNNSNVFVLPTYYKMEGQPISLLEGLASGNIILTTNHAGIPDIINQAHGFLIKPNSEKELFNNLIEINNNLKNYIEKYSNSNREYASLNFTENKFSSKIINLLDLVCGNNEN